MTDDGTIEPTADGYALRFVRQLAHPAPAVWAAITDPQARATWFFPGRLDLEAGGTVELTDSEHGIRGRTLTVQPPRLLEFTWDSKDGPGDTVVRFELTPTDQGCTLIFTHRVGADARPDRLAAGWHQLLDTLPGYLDGAVTVGGEAPVADGSWADYHRLYQGLV